MTNPDPRERAKAFASRALAALMVCDRTGCEASVAAKSVVDGRDDYGIDAVGVSDSIPHLWIIQSKWNQKGNAGIGVGDVLKMVEGFKKMDHQDYSSFNERLKFLKSSIRAVLDAGSPRVTFVIALMGGNDISSDVRQRLDEACNEFNAFGSMLDYKIVLAPEIWKIIQAGISDQSVDLSVKMHDWFRVGTPFDAYSGRVPVGEVAEWMQIHGDRLLEKNIRKSLGLTQVNQSMVDTLISVPHNFWYFNNGITVLCENFTATPFSRTSPHGPITLSLKAASVVNGAQTATAALEAMTRDPSKASQAYVGVRVIATGSESDNLPNDITKANNTQNHVERRDYVALDPVQISIREDFALSLQKLYIIKRGEIDPAPDVGCSVVHAAIALACSHTNPELAVRAKRDPDLLWEEGPTGAYRLLFSPAPTALQIWRSVLLLRSIRQFLHESQTEREGRGSAIAEHGDLLLAHVVFQHVGHDGIDDSEFDWNTVLTTIPELTGKALAWLIHHMDHQFGSSFVGSTLSSPERCKTLARDVLADLISGDAVPDVPASYLRPAPKPRGRRRNTVPILVDAGRIKDGTVLLFQPISEPEKVALQGWLAADPKRSRATWVNHRTKPLLWAIDGEKYSPTGLVQRIWNMAEWDKAPISVQGTMQWYLPNEGSLVSLAESILRAEELPLEGD